MDMYNLPSSFLTVTLPRSLQSALLLAGAFIVSACSNANEELPAMLHGVSSGSGYSSACPARMEEEVLSIRKLAISPELNQRLLEAFPPGATEEALTNFLLKQGFSFHGACDTDPLIRHASFNQKGKGFLAYRTHAQVFWEVDADGKVVWTKGVVGFSGL
jgi:hypothetical protein